MIPEPQRTYVLELLKALGPAAEDFVIAGAQAIKFMLKEARGTKDVDFVLDVARLREKEPSVRDVLGQAGFEKCNGESSSAAVSRDFRQVVPSTLFKKIPGHRKHYGAGLRVVLIREGLCSDRINTPPITVRTSEKLTDRTDSGMALVHLHP